jgi:single-strand DNA-binding protein
MARGINKVILVGNVGLDPEVRFLPNGNAVTNISIATSESWKDKQTGEKQERTEWHRVVCFNRLGEIVGEYVKKGSKLYLEGSLRTRKWQDPQGQDRYSTEIVASEVQMLDSKGGSSQSYQSAPQGQYQQDNMSAPKQAAHQKAPQTEATAQDAFDDLNDDIPF